MSISLSERGDHIIRVLVATLILAAVALVSAVSALLRPVADDYAHGALAIDGFWGATSQWWVGWSGDISLIIGQVLVVGMPLAWFPLGVASSVGFLLSGLFVGGLGVVVLGLAKNVRGWPVISVWAVITLSWWVFLWVRELAMPNSENRAVAEFLTHWQTVNVAYVIFPALNVAVFLFLIRGSLPRGKMSGAVVLMLGLIAGTSGLVMGAALAAFAMVVALAKWVTSGFRSTLSIFLYAVSAFGGVVIAISAPGARARSEYLPDVELQNFIFDIFRSVPRGVGNWLGFVISYETLLVMGVGVLTAWLVGVYQSPSRNRVLWETIVLLIPLSLLVSVIAAVSQLASYQAHWHFVSTRLLVFVSALALGHGLYFVVRGFLARKKLGVTSVWVVKLSTIASVLGLLSAGAVAMASSVIDRELAWESGEAPLRGAQDREEELWRTGWEKIEEHRSNRFGP